MSKRQVSRRQLVGCDNDQEMHSSLHEICRIFESYLTSQTESFLLGSKPTNADFAMYGQMSQWKVDMTPNKILRESYPFTFCWLDFMDDLSGLTVDDGMEFKLTKIAMDLLRVCGSVYLPFLQANDEALKQGMDAFAVDFEVNGKVIRHKQAPFKWQQKCLQVLRRKLENLKGDEGFDELQKILKETGCWDVLSQNLKMAKL